jgi:hypothetical protein
LIVFFAVYRPLGAKGEASARQHEDLRQMVRTEQTRLDLLKKYAVAMPDSQKGIEDFISRRAPSRREGYSATAHMIYKAADAAGVKFSTIAFHLAKDSTDPLEPLALEINVQGPYRGLLKFSHSLETAPENFLLVREFMIGPGGDNGALGLRLRADSYVTP